MCANLAANYLTKINIYENSISEKDSVHDYLRFIDEIFKHVTILNSIIAYSQTLICCKRVLKKHPNHYLIVKERTFYFVMQKKENCIEII